MLKRVPAAVLAGAASFALAAFLFAGDKPAPSPPAESPVPAESLDTADAPSAGPERPAYLVALQKEGGGSKAASSTPDAGWIGLMLEEGKDGKEKGIRVASVFPGGPAAFAGARAGDVLVKVGDAPAESLAKAVETIEGLAPGKAAKLAVRRNGRTLELTVNVGSLAEFHGRYAREMLRRDPRHPNFTLHPGVSDADMSVEVVRRLFEQNQRLETTLHHVLTELQALRAELREKK